MNVLKTLREDIAEVAGLADRLEALIRAARPDGEGRGHWDEESRLLACRLVEDIQTRLQKHAQLDHRELYANLFHFAELRVPPERLNIP